MPVTIADQKTAARWEKASDFFFTAAQTVTSIAQIPIISLMMNPIMNGLWGVWYVTSAIAFKYDPALKEKENFRHKEQHEKAQSVFNIASYIVGGIATVAGFLVLVPPLAPFSIPILLPIAAIAIAASSVLWMGGMAIDLYKEFKYGIEDAGHNWRLGQHALKLLYSIGTVVIAALMIASLFTPVGWAAGAGALTFAVATSISTLAVFSAAKFCQWQASRALFKAEHANTRQVVPHQAPTIKSQEKPKEKSEEKFELGPKFPEVLTEFRHKREQMMYELSEKLKDKAKGKDKNKGEGAGDKDGRECSINCVKPKI